MRRVRVWLIRLVGTVSGGRRERELAAELESHIQLHIDDNMRAGMSAEEARRAALLKFGPVESIKEDCRARTSLPLLEILAQDVRYALRRMRRQPGFTALVALTLALGVGANAAMFGLVDVLMFRTPAHVPEPDQIVTVAGAGNYVAYQDLRDRVHSLELTAYTRQRLSLGLGAEAVPLRTECVTPTYFAVAGTPAWRGRTFTPADDASGAPPAVVLSHSFWANRFGADPGVIGTAVVVGGRPHDIIGIAPPGFTGLGLAAMDAWILLAVSPEACSPSGTNLLRSSGGFWLTTVGRVRDGVTRAQAAAELAAVESRVEGRTKRLAADGTLVDGSLELRPVYASRRLGLSSDSRLALWLAGGAGVLFLLACANIAGLVWTHTLDRSREIAVRLQLGASRRRVFTQLTVEHMLTAALGGAAAVVAGMWISEGVKRYFPFAVDVDVMGTRTLVVVAVLACMAGLLSGAFPGFHAARSGPERYLRTGQTVIGAGSRFRTALLSVQVGLALVLVAAAGLFAGSVKNFRRDFAYDLDRVVVASIDFRRSSVRTPREIHAIFRMLEERVRQLPQVERAALSAGPILGAGGPTRIVAVRRSHTDANAEMNAVIEVTPDYFATVGLPMAAGRGFTTADAAGAHVLVINHTLATTLFPGDAPIGRCVFLGSGPCHAIVGVSEPFRASIRPDSQAELQIFAPLQQAGDSEAVPQVLLIRTVGRASGGIGAIAAALQGAAPDLPHVDVRTLEELADVQARSWLLGATIFGLFGTLAVILASIGIYGALAFTIRQRTVEIGVRMALGAMRRDIAGVVLRQGALVVAMGLVLGLSGALTGLRYVRSLLFNVAPADPWGLATAALVVALAALLGCVIPTLRAVRVDPAVALRYD
jgi:putative ABC transport system permease protein